MRPLAWPGLALLGLLGFSCAEGNGPGGGQASPEQGSAGSAGSGTPTAVLPDDEVPVDLGGGAVVDAMVAPVLDETNSCLSEVREAERVNVDLFVMLDRSGSMLNFTGDGTTGVTKWDAVTSALTEFLQNDETAEIGVGLRVFPQLNSGIPEACFSNDECLTDGPCSIPGLCPDNSFCTSETGCLNPNGTPMGYCENAPQFACTPGSNCRGGLGTCLPVECTDGYCADDPRYVCMIGVPCQDELGNSLGDCLPLGGYCVAGDTCEAADYATPDVPITLGADRNPALVPVLQAIEPTGFTPTTPALQGAIDYAQSWSQTHPDRVASVVLATDGFPSECTDPSLDPVPPVLQVAQDGAAAATPIRTYVIGVFSAEDGLAGASDILNSIALAGNTGQAYLVTTDGNVSQDFLTALQNISSAAIACEFLLPADDELDFDAVNLLFTRSDSQEVQLANVGSPEGCATGSDTGWYYVKDPNTGVPFQISVCPGVCQQFSQINGGRVDLQIGCETIIR